MKHNNKVVHQPTHTVTPLRQDTNSSHLQLLQTNKSASTCSECPTVSPEAGKPRPLSHLHTPGQSPRHRWIRCVWHRNIKHMLLQLASPHRWWLTSPRTLSKTVENVYTLHAKRPWKYVLFKCNPMRSRQHYFCISAGGWHWMKSAAEHPIRVQLWEILGGCLALSVISAAALLQQ